jgi:hypothetical protein
VSTGAVRRSFAHAQARLQARYGALAAEADWRRISGTRGLGAWLEEARGGPLRPWVQRFSGASSAHDIEAGVRELLFAEIDLVAASVPTPWRAAVLWTRWLPLLDVLAHLAAGGVLPGWARPDGPVSELLDEDGQLVQRRVEEAGIASLLDAGAADGLDVRWAAGWRQHWPDPGRPVRADLEALAGRLGAHLAAFRTASPKQAWTLRQQLRERLRFDFHRLGLSPAAPFVYLALVGLDLERLRRALLDRALFHESPAAAAGGKAEAA